MSDFDISSNLETVLNQINEYCAAAGRKPSDVELIAVSKTKPLSYVESAFEAGQRDFGENKIQDLRDRMNQLGDDYVWHMIGTLQTNKIKYLAPRVDWIHSVPHQKALAEIEKRVAQHERTINVLIQVNVSGEDQKSGCSPDELSSLLEFATTLKHVSVRGLMAIAAFEEDLELVRPQFRLLRELRDQFADQFSGNIKLEHLSMGMSHDMKVAIEEGATMVRVGTAIFGARNYT